MNASKYFLFVVLMLIGLNSKSQTLLNLNLREINKFIVLSGGGLVHKSNKEAKFSYVIPPEGNDCIFNTTCYFTSRNICFKYVNTYWGYQLPNQEIDRLKKYFPNLKKVDNKPQWRDYIKGFEITLIHDKNVHGAYSLKIETINGKS